MNLSGSAWDALNLRRAPVSEISTITHGPKAVPSVPIILAPWSTNRRGLFRCSGRISHLISFEGSHILRPGFRPPNSLSAARAVRIRPAQRYFWRLSGEPAKIEEPSWRCSATIWNTQSAPYRRLDLTSYRQLTGNSGSREPSASPTPQPYKAQEVPRDSRSVEGSRSLA